MSFEHPQIEVLAQQLCKQIARRNNPFEKIHIWVPHQGLASWLRHTIATELGVAAHLQFSQPRTALWQMAQQLFPQRRLKLGQVELLLSLQNHLGAWAQQHPKLAIFAQYLQRTDYLLSLAKASAQTFEDYLTYRPDWIVNFSRCAPGELPLPAGLSPFHEDLWQAQHQLWQLLEAQVDPEGRRWNRAQLQFAVLDRLSQGPLEAPPTAWPGQGQIPLQVFAISEEAPFYQQMLTHLPQQIALQQYHLDESALSSRGSFAYPYWQEGLSENDHEADSQSESNLLPTAAEIDVHGCHHALREVEVLQDLIKERQTPAGQVGVMIGDLEHYRPLIHGLFREQFLPYQILQAPQDNLLVQSFEALIELHQGRLQREDVIALLENEWIAQAFGLQVFSAQELRQTLDQADIRWGRNDFHRQQLGLPAFGQNSWEAGLQRLVLTYALPDQGQEPFLGHLPAGQEMPNLAILRALLRFFDASQRYLNPLFKDHTLPQWSQIFHRILEQFLDSADTEMLLPLREAIGRLPDLLKHIPPQQVLLSEAEQDFSLAEAQSLLKLCWSQGKLVDFHHGRIVFGTPEQLVGIPFQDLYILGLNLGSVPAKASANDLDLRLQSPARVGEIRSQTGDLRMFLRAMQSARQRLTLIYQSHHLRHQNELPPAGIVDALLHAIKGLKVKHHALQAFDSKYFQQGTGLISYHPLYRKCAESLSKTPSRTLPPPFRQAAIPATREMTDLLNLQAFCAFFQHPSASFLRQGLGVYYAGHEEAQAAHERFQITGLEKYLLQVQALQGYIHYRGDLEPFKERLLSSGHLPVGQAGRWYLEQALQDLVPYYPLLSTFFDLPIQHQNWEWQASDGRRLQKQYLCYSGVTGLASDLHLEWHPGRLNARRTLSLWIDHLLLQAANTRQTPVLNACLGLELKKRTPSLFYFEPLSPAQAQAYLSQFYQLYLEGQALPLEFAPETSRAFAEDYLTYLDTSRAEKAARKVWEPGYFNLIAAESEDAYFAHCLEVDWFTLPEAQAIALAIWEPIDSHLRGLPLTGLDQAAPFAFLNPNGVKESADASL